MRMFAPIRTGSLDPAPTRPPPHRLGSRDPAIFSVSLFVPLGETTGHNILKEELKSLSGLSNRHCSTVLVPVPKGDTVSLTISHVAAACAHSYPVTPPPSFVQNAYFTC
jgi:hypothetical protein